MRFAVLGCIWLAACAAPRRKGHMTLGSIPAAAAETIRTQMKGAQLAQLETDPDQDSYAIDATWYVGGVRHEITVGEDGRLIDRGVEVVEAQVPAIVVEAARHAFEHAGELRYLKRTDGKYTAQTFRGKKRRKHELVIFADGTVDYPDPDCDTE